MRLIDADALLKRAHYIETGDLNGYSILYPHDVLDAPTVDTVPTESEFKRIAIQRGYVSVIRCKECIYANTERCTDGLCWCDYMETKMFEEGYCSYGKRRNDE